MEIGIYCYLTTDILTKVLQKCSLSSPLPDIRILSKLLNLNCCRGNRNTKFSNKYSKIISSKAIKGMKLKLCKNVHNISLYKSFLFIAVAHVLSLLPLTYNAKSEVGLYYYLTADILRKRLQKCSLSISSTKHMNFVQTDEFD